MEAADVGGEPGDPGHPHVDAGGDLAAVVLEGGVDVAGPHEGAVPLAARPGAAHEVDDLVLAGRALPLVEGAREHLRVEVADLGVGAEVVAEVVEVVDAVFGLGLVEPERLDAEVEVVLAAQVPDELPGGGIGRVEEHARALELHLHVDAAFGAHEQVVLLHGVEVLGLRRDLRPDGDHELDTEVVELVGHGPGVGPELLVEAEVAHLGPVEEVRDDHVQRQAAALVLAGHLEQLLLVPVAQLALPETEAVLRHHRGVAGRVRVRRRDLGGGVARGHPVVELFRGLGEPLGAVHGEGGAPDRGVVPEESIPRAGHHERDAGLGVAVGELERAALDVEDVLLVLAHPVELFGGVGLERRGDPEVAAEVRLQVPRLEVQRATGVELLEQERAVAVVEAQRAPVHAETDEVRVERSGGQHDGEPTVGQPRDVALDIDRHRAGRLRQQGEVGVQHVGHHGGPHAHTVRAPRLDDHRLAVAAPQEPGAVDLEDVGRHSTTSRWIGAHGRNTRMIEGPRSAISVLASGLVVDVGRGG